MFEAMPRQVLTAQLIVDRHRATNAQVPEQEKQSIKA